MTGGQPGPEKYDGRCGETPAVAEERKLVFGLLEDLGGAVAAGEVGLVATGRTEVAVKKRLQVIFQKLGAVDRAHAVAEAIRRGLI